MYVYMAIYIHIYAIYIYIYIYGHNTYIDFSKVVDLAESFRMRYSRASGRPFLSRYGHFSVNNQPLPNKNSFYPKTCLITCWG